MGIEHFELTITEEQNKQKWENISPVISSPGVEGLLPA